jgi:lipoprotein-anchoring transpeptidase ErfK/SrfK
MPDTPRLVRHAGRFAAVAVIVVFVGSLVTASIVAHRSPVGPVAAPPAAVAPPAAPPVVVPPARPAPRGLAVIEYEKAPPHGFPADPAPLSTESLRSGVRVLARVAAYDAPGGRPRAFLPPDIDGVPLTLPVVAQRVGWTAVLLPSTNRRIGWLPPARTWTLTPLRDLIIVERRAHRLTWMRDGVRQHTWRVTLGLPVSPTPLGRTFVLGRSTLYGYVYGETDVFALGAVPDDRDSVPWGLRGAHIGIHTWYHDGDLGRDTTDGCIRLTRSGQRLLLTKLVPGTPVVVVDRLPAVNR